tara:strand:+ start:241 stop:891 length:651 start_codon:yes stop_codon:yes gene_type:complete
MIKKIIKINCKKIFFDFDGVIVDSNKFKEKAIKDSINELNLKTENLYDAFSYFNSHAGEGRRKKLLKFFNESITEEILIKYSKKCIQYFENCYPTIGFINFIKVLKENYPKVKLYILSGGDYKEIICFLKANQMENLFFKILYDNYTKSQHLINEKANKNDLFFGDSKGDLKTAKNHSLSFIYINGFCSLNSKPNYIDEEYAKISINNFSNIEIKK